jgi:uncharacterized protein with PIN domain
MGAHDYIIRFNISSLDDIQAEWNKIYEDDSYDSGSGPYAGNATTLGKRIAFHDKRLASEEEARDFILENHQKWSEPLGCSFYLSMEPNQRWTNKRDKAHEKKSHIEKKLLSAKAAVKESFVTKKSKFVGCKICDSKLSHEHMVNIMNQFHANIPKCPVCKSELISKTDRNRIDKLEEKLAHVVLEYKSASKLPVGKKMGWCVGGWAAS